MRLAWYVRPSAHVAIHVSISLFSLLPLSSLHIPISSIFEPFQCVSAQMRPCSCVCAVRLWWPTHLLESENAWCLMLRLLFAESVNGNLLLFLWMWVCDCNTTFRHAQHTLQRITDKDKYSPHSCWGQRIASNWHNSLSASGFFPISFSIPPSRTLCSHIYRAK